MNDTSIDLVDDTLSASGQLSTADRVPKSASHNPMALQKRIDWFDSHHSFSLREIKHHKIDPQRLRGVIENFVGAVHIPVGLAGPLLINGEHAQGVFVAPFATVEGVMTLSASRGAYVINDSGGIRVKVLQRQMSRAPVFQFSNLDECERFVRWIRANYQTIEGECNKLSRHGKLEAIEDYIIGNTVHLKFCFYTGDAAGQNMVTIMTDNATIWIRAQLEAQTGLKLRFYAVEGNLAGDKKLNFMNLNSPSSARGARVFTEVFLTRQAMAEHFDCSVEQFINEANHGAAANTYAGTPGGLSINAVNAIAAMYAATGQDLGCIVESSSQHIFCEAAPDGVYWSSTFSSIITGTKSNAQRLPTQNECLEMLGCNIDNGAVKLAEIIAAFAVALDISTLASVANDTFAKAHRIGGRG